jgi:glycosyltransferase involved in cell wall biosynthesis
LEAIYPTALRLAKGLNCKEAPIFLELERAFGTKSREFDLIHSHVDITGFPFARRCSTPVLTTLHGRLDLPELLPMFQEFPEMPVNSISNAQRRPVGWLNWQETVYHGLPADLYSFHPQPGKYLAFLGRISPEKRPDHAIALAKHAGMPLRIAAKVDPVVNTSKRKSSPCWTILWSNMSERSRTKKKMISWETRTRWSVRMIGRNPSGSC